MTDMRRRSRMQGPGPVNIGGTGRKRKWTRRQPIREETCGTERNCQDSRADTGKLGETIALEYLLQMGYKLLERNWRCRHKEIDLIMEGGDGIHIVEVRTRKAPAAIAPELTVDKYKQSNIEAAARSYVRMSGYMKDIHFDIVSVILDSLGNVLRTVYLKDAFLPIGDKRQTQLY